MKLIIFASRFVRTHTHGHTNDAYTRAVIHIYIFPKRSLLIITELARTKLAGQLSAALSHRAHTIEVKFPLSMVVGGWKSSADFPLPVFVWVAETGANCQSWIISWKTNRLNYFVVLEDLGRQNRFTSSHVDLGALIVRSNKPSRPGNGCE